MQQTCPNCGAENYDFARYCRKCGFRMSTDEFHEAPTRGFDHQRPEAPPFAPAPEPAPSRYSPPSGAGYAPELRRGPTMRPGSPGTSPMPPVRIDRKGGPNWFLIVGVFLLVALLGGATIGIILVKRVTEAVATAPNDGGGVIPSVQVQEGGDIDPDSLSAELKPFYYPGADIQQTVSGSMMGMGGSVLIMTSDDERQEIESHYKEIFADAKDKREIRDGQETVLGSGPTSVIIHPSDENAELFEIVVALGKGVPGAGSVPTPPAVPEIPEGQDAPDGVPPPPPKPPAAAPPAPKQ